MLKILSLKNPINMIILVNIIGFVLLYLYKQPSGKGVLAAGLLIIALICTVYFVIVKKRLGDEYLFLIVSMLASIGMIMVYRLDKTLGFRQIIWFCAGTALFFLSYFIYDRLDGWSKLVYFYPAASFTLFIVTLVLGKDIRGAKNWIVIGSYSFQPSELIKVLFVFFLASYYNNTGKLDLKKITMGKSPVEIGHRIVFQGVVYVFLGFLILQREWGTALLFFIIHFILMYVLEDEKWLLFINALLAAAGATAGYMLVYHIKIRVDMWLDPWKDITGKGYQVTQSLFAIAAGGFFGTGLGMGRPDLIPDVYTDFIFSAICEEMGLFGGMAVVLLFFVLAYRGFKIALTIKEPFEKTLAMGITLVFGFQTFIILGGVTKFIPLTGITLPFISYGGSSLTTSFVALGILQAISKKAY